MKVSLVVAQGVHQGKVIPIPVTQFLIGRDEGCQLRPSSPAISKKHCSLIVRRGKLLLQDFGSTNGTFVNDAQVTGEVEVKNEDRIRVGPLEFVLKVERTPGLRPSQDELKPPSAISMPTPAPKDEPTKEEPTVAKKKASAEDDAEHIAAMLLGTDDGPPGPVTEDNIPGGSTVFELPAVADPNAPAEAKKAAPVAEPDNSKKAAEILRKYMQRPRT